MIKVLGWLALLGLVFCLPAKAEVVDRIIAIVNDDIILQSEYEAFVKPIEKRIRQQVLPEEKQHKLIRQMRVQVLDQLIDKKLAEQQIKKLNIVVSEQEIDNSLERIKQANFYTDEELLQILEQDGVTLQQYREEIKSQIERARLVSYEVRSKIVITDDDIKRYYEQNKDKYGGKVRLHLRHILMVVPPGADSYEQDQVLKRMQRVHRKLLQGEQFQELARLYSESPVAAEGGDLGLIDPQNLDESIKKAIESLKEGEFSSVLKTDQGYQIFYLEKRVTTDRKTLDMVRDEIRRTLYNRIVDKKYKQWLKELKARSHIHILHHPQPKDKEPESDASG